MAAAPVRTLTASQELPAEDVDDASGAGEQREFRPWVDPATGRRGLIHEQQSTGADGSSQQLRIILLDNGDGTVERTVDRRVQLGSDLRHDVVVATMHPDGRVIAEHATRRTARAGDELVEETRARFDDAGQLVHQQVQVDRTQQVQGRPRTTGQVELHVRGTWDNGGAPIPPDFDPAIQRTEVERLVEQGAGINRDTPRTIQFTRSAAGTLSKLAWEPHGTLTVRFDGRGGQYIERELRVPLGPGGEPDMARADTVSTTDAQSGTVKALTHARVWGGLVSNLSWMVGVNLLRAAPRLGQGLVVASAAAAGAQAIGEGHALVDRRNDGSTARLGMALYDTALSTLLAGFVLRRPSLLATPGGAATTGLAGLGAVGVAANASELVRDGRLRMERFPAGRPGALADATLGAEGARSAPASQLLTARP